MSRQTCWRLADRKSYYYLFSLLFIYLLKSLYYVTSSPQKFIYHLHSLTSIPTFCLSVRASFSFNWPTKLRPFTHCYCIFFFFFKAALKQCTLWKAIYMKLTWLVLDSAAVKLRSGWTLKCRNYPNWDFNL